MTKRIPLTQGGSALVDDVDFEWLSAHKWQRNLHGYAVRDARMMSREVIEKSQGIDLRGLVVHHVNGDCLDNRRSNLKVLTYQEHSRGHWAESEAAVVFDSQDEGAGGAR